MPDEIWKPVRRHRMFPHSGYQASSEASIRSVPRTLRDGRTAGGVVLAQQADKDGYPTVKVQGKRYRVNILVQLAFAGPPEVRHKDGNRKNCKPGNLVYGSRVENEQDKNGTEGNKDREDKCSRPFPVGTFPVTGVTDGA